MAVFPGRYMLRGKKKWSIHNCCDVCTEEETV
jgi:hypothetical protein